MTHRRDFLEEERGLLNTKPLATNVSFGVYGQQKDLEVKSHKRKILVRRYSASL